MDWFPVVEDTRVEADSALYLDGEPIAEPTSITPLATSEALVVEFGDITYGTLPDIQVDDALADNEELPKVEVDDVAEDNTPHDPLPALAHIALESTMTE